MLIAGFIFTFQERGAGFGGGGDGLPGRSLCRVRRYQCPLHAYQRGGKSGRRRSQDTFIQVNALFGIRRPCFIRRFVIAQYAGKLRLILRPFGKSGFLFLFVGQHAVLFKLFRLPVIKFPVVGNTGIGRSQLQLYGRIFLHLFKHRFQSYVAQIYQGRVFDACFQLDTVRGFIAVGAAGISEDHGEIIFLYALNGYREEILGLQRHIVRSIRRGLAIFAGIYPENGEIAGVAGPFPVISVAAKLAHAFRGSAHQADVFITLIHKQQVLVAFEHRHHFGFVAGIRNCFADNAVVGFLLLLGPVGAFQSFHGFLHLFAHVFHPDEELHRQLGRSNFLLFIFCVEAVLQVIMFHRTGGSDGGIAAVMVGED